MKHSKNLTLTITLVFLFLFIIPLILTADPSQSPQIEKEPSDPSLITRVVEELKSKVPAWFEETDIPGMAIAVVDDEKIHWQQVYGHTTRNQDRPIDSETIFSIQSMSKSFTALGRDFYPLKLFLGREGLVGKFGQFSELRFKPFLNGRPGTIVTLHRKSGNCRYYDFHKPDASQDKPGPNKPEWQRYLGSYRILTWGRVGGGIVRVATRGGYLTWNGTRCHEYLPGLFFQYTGEALDLRGK